MTEVVDIQPFLQSQREAEFNGDCHFGVCPECGRNDGYLNAGRGHWFLCEEHKARWFVGSNLFSSWRHETEEEQRAEWERVGMPGFREVESVHDPQTIRRLRRNP